MFLHKVIHKSVVSKIPVLKIIDQFMNKVDKINRMLEILHKGVMGNLFGILNLFVVKECFEEFKILFAHLF